MPRKYIRKTKRQSWTPQQLKAARHDVDCGMSVNATAAKFGIPRSTLVRRIESPEMPLKMGPRETIFTVEQEREIVEHILNLESRFYGITQKDVQKLAYELAERNQIPNPFNEDNKMAGRDWLAGFLKRNPEISFRKPEATSAARARGFNKPAVQAFFDLYEGILEKKGFKAAQIYNADETGISTVPPKKAKIAARKGKKQVGSITSAERGETTSVMMCMSATGHFLPPFVIFPRKRLTDALQRGAPAGTKFECNETGYMNIDVMDTWFDFFVENVKPSEDSETLLLIDGHSSHTKNLAFAEKAKKNFVTVVVLPPHCSNKMQPLDLTFMGPFKTHYANATEVFMRQHPGRVVGLNDVAELMATAFNKTCCTSIATSGFRASGLWPCNRHVFPDEAYAPSQVTDISEVQPGVESGATKPSPFSDKATQTETHMAEQHRELDYGKLTNGAALESSSNVSSMNLDNSSIVSPPCADDSGLGSSFIMPSSEADKSSIVSPSSADDSGLGSSFIIPSSDADKSSLESSINVTLPCVDDSSIGSTFNVPPSSVLPLPKMTAPRNTKRKRKAQQSFEITSDAYRQELAALDAAKEIKLIKKKKQPSKRSKPVKVPEDTLCDQCGLRFGDSVDGTGWKKCPKCAIRFHAVCYDYDDMCDVCT